MPEPEDRYDRLILWIVKHVPARGVLLLAGLSYLGVGLAVPLLLDLPKPWLFDLNVFGTIFAASLLFGWAFVQIQARDRRHLLEWTSDLRLLDGEEFEWLVGEVFRREGWTVRERGRQDAPDGNVDLELIRPGERRLVQCKRWQAWRVGVDEIRRFVGTLTREGLPPSAGVFVTLSRFTGQAEEEAKKAGLDLVDNAELHARVEKVRRPESCPLCASPMVLDHSIHGWWFRCVSKGCSGKRHLDRDPGRAIALLTHQG